MLTPSLDQLWLPNIATLRSTMIILLWQHGWNRIASTWEAEREKDVHTLLLHIIAANDPHIEAFGNLGPQRFNKHLELREVLTGVAEVDVLVLEPHTVSR